METKSWVIEIQSKSLITAESHEGSLLLLTGFFPLVILNIHQTGKAVHSVS